MAIELYDANKVVLGHVNVMDYIAGTPDEDTDYSSELQQAHDDALAAGLGVYVPPGEYGIAATVNVKVSMTGPSGGNMFASRVRFKPLITNGTAIIKTGNNTQAGAPTGIYLGNFSIATQNIFTSVSVNKNAVGIDFGYGKGLAGAIEDHAVWHSTLENVWISDCKVGLQTSGWLNRFSNVLVWSADVGIKGYWVSDCHWDAIRIERGLQGFEFERGNGCFFSTLSEEGDAGTTASTIDEVTGYVIGSYRTEQASRGQVPWLVIGNTAKCFDVRILGGLVYTPAEPTPAIELREIDGYEIGCAFTTGTNSRTTTSKIGSTQGKIGFSTEQNNHHSVGTLITERYPIQNTFPNSDIRGIKFPFAVETQNASMTSSYSTALRWLGRAGSSIVTTVTSGNGNAFTKFVVSSQPIIGEVNKQHTVAAWVYVPDLPAFHYGGDAVVSLSASTTVASTEGAQTHSRAAAYTYGRWNLMFVHITIPSACEALNIYFNITTSATALSNGEHLGIGKVFVCEGQHQDDFANNEAESTAISGCNYLSVDGIEFTDTIAGVAVIKALPLNRWTVGDRLTYTDPVSGGNLGEVCTTAGTGAAAVWKTYGAIA